MENKFNFFKSKKENKVDPVLNEDFEAKSKQLEQENAILKRENSVLKSEISELQNPKNDIEALYKENAIFVPELKPFAEKVLELMQTGNNLQMECNKFYEKEKNNAVATPLLNKAFAKFQNGTFRLKIGDWCEQLNNIVYNNGILIKPPIGKENNHSSAYATIRQGIKEFRTKEQLIKSFEDDISIALLDRYCGALLVLIEDMKLLEKNGVFIPKNIEEIHEKIRVQIKEKLGLKINDITLLEKLNNNSYIDVIDEVDSPLTNESERVVEVLFYGVGRNRVSNTHVIISK